MRIFRCSSRSRPASSVDSPSRSRSFVPTLRELNDGTSCPADADAGPERAALDDEAVEHDLPFVGHPRRHLEVDADGLVVERRLGDAREAAGRRGAEDRREHRNLVAEVQRQLRPLGPAQLRLRDQLGARVLLEEPDDRRRHGEVEVGGADPLRDRVQVERRRRGRRDRPDVFGGANSGENVRPSE